MAERKDTLEWFLAEGEKLMQNQFYDRAILEFNKAYKLDSSTTNLALEKLFRGAEETGDYEGIISVGTSMLQHQPGNSQLANVLGNTHRRLGNFAQASKFYQHCLKYDPKHRFASYNLAAAMARADLYDGNVVNAITPFERMEGPKLPDNKEGEQRLKAIQQKIDAAQQEEKEKGEGDKSEGEDWQDQLDGELEPKKQEEPKKKQKVVLIPEEILIYIRKNRDMPALEMQEILKFLAFYAIENSFPKVAWRALTRLLFYTSQDENFRCFMALTYHLRGEKKLAIDQLLSILEENQYNRYANVNLGYLYQEQKNYNLARKYFVIASQLLEKSKDHYNMQQFRSLGEQYYRDEIYKNAQRVFEVLREESVAPDILERLGHIYLEQEMFDGAMEVYKLIMEDYYEQPEVKEAMVKANQMLLNKARKYMEIHKYTRAARMYEISLEIEHSKTVIEDTIGAYKLLRDEEGIKRMNILLRNIQNEEREREIVETIKQKLKEGKVFEKKKRNYEAIRCYEEALRLKPDQNVLIQLVRMYKKTRQREMIQDVTERYNKAIERQQRLAELEAEEQENQD
ncbi:MAG: tetratricopeptide repeat protein [SAR324 cluster bacterium]|nr:tetratricopeptide repeat protein [SAR324 cluster bacterium]